MTMCGTSKWLPGTQKALPGWGNTIGTPQEHPVNHSFLNFLDEIPYTKNVENNLEVKKKTLKHVFTRFGEVDKKICFYFFF